MGKVGLKGGKQRSFGSCETVVSGDLLTNFSHGIFRDCNCLRAGSDWWAGRKGMIGSGLGRLDLREGEVLPLN